MRLRRRRTAGGVFDGMGPLQRGLRATIVGLAVALVIPASAFGLVPIIQSTGSSQGKPTVTWSLPAGVESTKVAVATSPDLDTFGEFPLGATVISAVGIGPTQTSWTADKVLANGTYYVHVEGKDGPVFDWSSVQSLVVDDAVIAANLLLAGHTGGKATATWSLPPDVEVVTIEVATSPATTGTGNFESQNVVDLQSFLGTTQTAWTSSRTLNPGTYYLHIGTRHTNCIGCPTRSWTSVNSFVVTANGGSGSASGSDGSGGSDGGSDGESGSSAPAPKLKRGKVIRIINGDAFVVRLNSGKKERVQLLGIDAPDFRPRECFARKAKKELARIVLGKKVVLRLDPTQRLRTAQGRLLAYANRPGKFDVGKRMLALGAAEVVQPKLGFLRNKAYRMAEKKAERLDRGLWGFCSA